MSAKVIVVPKRPTLEESFTLAEVFYFEFDIARIKSSTDLDAFIVDRTNKNDVLKEGQWYRLTKETIVAVKEALGNKTLTVEHYRLEQGDVWIPEMLQWGKSAQSLFSLCLDVVTYYNDNLDVIYIVNY